MQKAFACIVAFSLATASSILCGCSQDDCSISQGCENAHRFCSTKGGELFTQKGDDVLTDPYRRRAIINAASSRLLTSDTSKSFRPMWDSGRNLTSSEPWTLVETWKSEKAEVDLAGGLFVSGSDGLAVFAGNWVGSCDRRHVDDCFPLALSPALAAVRRRGIERLVLVGRGQEITTAFDTLPSKLPAVKTLYIENLELPLPPIEDHTCALLCPISMANIPVTTFEGTLRSPFVGAQYIYVPLPGAFERFVWLCALSSVVLIGSWQGKYQLTLS